MTLLHDFFNSRNLQHFQRLLDGASDRKQSGGGQSTSGGKSSWNRASPLATLIPNFDVNARDWLGRTVLHLACTSPDYIEYARALLKHPNINVNLGDQESHWTPLHRALYHANLPAAQLLLQRSDIDPSLKDSEGYTAFDLYNSTINGTKPDVGEVDAELFTWGANRNAALGLGDGNDRGYPDQVVIHTKEDFQESETKSLAVRFMPIHTRQIQMSKLHTAIITSEDSGNVRVCGFGSGGRLGPGQHTQYSLKPLPQFNHSIISVALGQDHTLALTKAGEVLSWGLNRFSQLGYVVETTSGKHDEPIQTLPKKIYGPLKKEVAIGVAASKAASACWTRDEVFTWGTNNGQLGYDKNAQPVQVIPRKVTKFSHPITAMSLTDNAMVCLLATQQVECIWNDRHYRINFPVHAFPSEIQPYRPPQAIKDAHIAKITACDDAFAALSSNGEVFMFSPPTPLSDAASLDGNSAGRESIRAAFKPQRVWALRKKFSAVKDVALGSDGSIIICTESGHVYVRIRNAKGTSGKNFKFQRIPYLQRVTKVCANSTGAFGALRVDFKAKKICVGGNTIAQDLAHILPFHSPFGPTCAASPDTTRRVEGNASVSSLPDPPSIEGVLLAEDGYGDDEPEDLGIEQDIATLRFLLVVLKREQDKVKSIEGSIEYDGVRLPHGADTLIRIGNLAFPVHRVLLAARSAVLRSVLDGNPISAQATNSKANVTIRLMARRPGPGVGVPKLTMVTMSGVHPLSVLILLHYIYSDEVLAIWDRRVHSALATEASAMKIDSARTKAELQVLARALQLPYLAQVLEAPVKRIPTASLVRDLNNLFSLTQDLLERTPASAPDVLLELEDTEVWTHSVILRARSEFFASLFGEEVWTLRRWGADGVLRVHLKHLRWHVMQYVLRFLLCGEGEEMFEVLPFAKSVDDVLEFMFEVMAAATEFLLDRLILECSTVVLSYLTICNCCYILAEATHYHAVQLIESVEGYIAANAESLLESGMLDDLPYDLLKQLSNFIRSKQSEKSPFSRTQEYIDGLVAKHWDWLSLQDIPAPIERSLKPSGRDAVKTKISPPVSREPAKARVPLNLPLSPNSLHRRPSGDDIFAMDVNDVDVSAANPPSATAWKVTEAPRIDMKTLMAEAQLSSRTPAGPPIGVAKYISKIPLRDGRNNENGSPLSGSPLKTSTRASAQPSMEGRDQSSPSVPSPLTPSKAPRAQSSQWKIQKEHPQSPSGHQFPKLTSPSASTSSAGGLSTTRPPPSHVPPRAPLAQPVPSSSAVGLGPMFAPTKQLSSKSSSSGMRNTSGGKAWASTPPKPVATNSQSTSLSFAAIQQSQQEQPSGNAKDKRSLREIQQEEEAQQAEADFLKWWEAEEERAKQEIAALEAYQNQLSKPPQKPSRRRGKPEKRVEAGQAAVGDDTCPGSSSNVQGKKEGQRRRPPRKQPPAEKGKLPAEPRK